MTYTEIGDLFRSIERRGLYELALSLHGKFMLDRDIARLLRGISRYNSANPLWASLTIEYLKREEQ